MFFKSIRWRLQLWYGIILLLVLGGFGLTAYRLQRGREYREIDAELHHRLTVLSTALRNQAREPGPGGERPGRPPRDGPPEEMREPGPEGGPEEFLDGPGKIRLPERQSNLFSSGESNGFYYVIWKRDGAELTRSATAPATIAAPESARPSAPPAIRMRGSIREVFLATPPGEVLLVGHSVAAELADLRQVAWRLSLLGFVILVFGLAGGWVMTTYALRPVREIGATAIKISAGDLSQRIDVADTDSELGQLAGVLNSTFTRLEASFAQQARFTADAAHELRTPITVMLTQTQFALARDRTAADYRETIEACQRAAQRMRRLIESLLELARLDASEEPLVKKAFDLEKVTRDCVQLVSPMAAQRAIKIETRLSEVTGFGDPDRLAQVITNLLTNAIHYNHDGGRIEVMIEQAKEDIVLKVSDTGVGISREDLPHVFERFFRVEKSRTSGRTGLGLSISQAIVEGHGGTIELVSQLGEGTTFTVRLPAAPSSSGIRIEISKEQVAAPPVPA
jgi:heavy metal sensor kinase